MLLQIEFIATFRGIARERYEIWGQQSTMQRGSNTTTTEAPAPLEAEIARRAWMPGHDVVPRTYLMKLRDELAHWVTMLANTSPDYAKYRALNAGRGLPSDKQPGVRPIACGESWMRLIARCADEAECREQARDVGRDAPC